MAKTPEEPLCKTARTSKRRQRLAVGTILDMPVTEIEVLDSLKVVIDPDLHRDIVTLGFIKEIVVDGSQVSVTIELTTPACPVRESLQSQAVEAIRGIPGVEEAIVTMTAKVRQKPGSGGNLIPGVKHCIAVASGKGGVGKSTVTVNLAIALSQTGAKVGILDADVYGPTIPLLLGVPNDAPSVSNDKILPIERFGIVMMSIGCLVQEGQTLMWRGPMVAGTVKQLLEDVAWGDLDYLIVDLPPGTGDASMSLAQLVPLTGAIIVSTPHNVAANIAGKAVALFRRLNTPILGVVENMGPFTDSESGETKSMFHGMPGSALAVSLQCPYLGSIPFDPRISEAGDLGRPSLIHAPNQPQAAAVRSIAGAVASQASIIAMTRSEASDQEPASEPVVSGV